MTKTVTRLFDTYADAQAAVAALEAQGIPHSDISLVANNAQGSIKTMVDDHDGDHDHHREGHIPGDASGKGFGIGGFAGGAAGLLAGLGLLAIPGLGPVAAAGWLVSTVVGAAAGAGVGGVTGGIIDAMMHEGVSKEHAHVYAEGVRRGGTLVSVRAPDDQAAAVESLLQGYNPVDPDTRGADYRAGGWSSFDPDAEPYAADQDVRERAYASRT